MERFVPLNSPVDSRPNLSEAELLDSSDPNDLFRQVLQYLPTLAQLLSGSRSPEQKLHRLLHPSQPLNILLDAQQLGRGYCK